MRASARLRIVGVLAAATAISAGCEALVGIHNKELLIADASVGEGSEGGVGAEPGAGASDVGAEGAQAEASPDDATGGEASGPGDAGDGGSVGAGDGGDAGDARVGDAGGPKDAGDGATPVDPDVPCAQQPSFIFCDDFDLVTTVGQTWGWNFSNVDGGTFQFDTVDYRSAPKSMQATVPAVTSGVGDVQLGKDVGVLTTGVRVAFDYRIDLGTLTGMPQVGIAQVLIARAGSGIQADYVIGPGAGSNLLVYAGDAGGMTVNTGQPPLRTWTRIAMSYDQSTGLSLYENGVLIGSIAVGAGAPGDVTVIVGGVYTNPSGTATVTLEMDNVVVTGH